VGSVHLSEKLLDFELALEQRIVDVRRSAEPIRTCHPRAARSGFVNIHGSGSVLGRAMLPTVYAGGREERHASRNGPAMEGGAGVEPWSQRK
jgi:hypothetical protein